MSHHFLVHTFTINFLEQNNLVFKQLLPQNEAITYHLKLAVFWTTFSLLAGLNLTLVNQYDFLNTFTTH